MNPIENIQISSTDLELFAFSKDFIKLNRNITNEQIPDTLLEFWSVPNSNADKDCEPSDVPLFIFILIVDSYIKSRKKGEEVLEIGLDTFLFSQLFYIFQVVLATTIHCRKHHLPIKPFQLFRIEKYHIPKIEEPEQLCLEYLRLTQASDSRYSEADSRVKREKISNNNKQLEISFKAEPNHLFFMETAVWQILSHFNIPLELLGKINLSIVESINHSIIYINESEIENHIKLTATKTKKQFKVTILCGEKSSSPKPCKFNPIEPTDDADLKGRSLHLMKNLPDRISFLDNGAEVRLTFNIK